MKINSLSLVYIIKYWGTALAEHCLLGSEDIPVDTRTISMGQNG